MNGKHKQWLQWAVFIVFNTLFYYVAAKEKHKEQTINKIKKEHPTLPSGSSAQLQDVHMHL